MGAQIGIQSAPRSYLPLMKEMSLRIQACLSAMRMLIGMSVWDPLSPSVCCLEYK